MWGTVPYRSGGIGQAESCWEVNRDAWAAPHAQSADDFWAGVLDGRHCDMNWLEGLSYADAHGAWGAQSMRPPFSADAPALLGFDGEIDNVCSFAGSGERQAHCVERNFNVLGLFGPRVPYNLCRNLEWQVCGARGRLPGQMSATLVFAEAPGWLYVDDNLGAGAEGHPLDGCTGFSPYTCQPPDYATDTIFYLEVCNLAIMCENGDELFGLSVGAPWQCRFSQQGLERLRQLLTTDVTPRRPPPPMTPPPSSPSPPAMPNVWVRHIGANW